MQRDAGRFAPLYAYAVDRHRSGDFAGAEQTCQKILAAKPDHFDAMHMLGALRAQHGRYDEALALIGAALKINRRSSAALSNYADVLAALSRWDEAAESYDRALILDPGNPVTLNQRGIALQKLGRFADAVRSFDRALIARPAYATALNNRGTALFELGRFDEAIASYDAALKLESRNPGTWNNRGLALLKLSRFSEAIENFTAGLAMAPRHAELLTNRGIALRDTDRQAEAVHDFDSAIQADPAYSNAWWNKAVSKLLLGDFAQGLPLYEWRKRLNPPVEARIYSQPLWTGAEDIRDKTLFLYVEQGLGDTIQFYRFVAPLLARGACVILSVQDSLLRLLENARPQVELVDSKTVPAAFDYHIPLMSLPLALGVTVASIPASVPYLKAEPARAARWRARIGEKGFKIGISWQGATSGIASRAMPLTFFQGLSRLPDVRLISLQKGFGAEQLADLPAVESLGEEFDSGPDAFLDSTAVMQSLDLVITLDSALAHLAGALGRPVWVALKRVPDWRWLLGRADSPWYPGMVLFRQKMEGDWAGVFAEMESQVRR
jgi:tetratricopeptide (TPR) repeat protein